jgi:hypothetical protein
MPFAERRSPFPARSGQAIALSLVKRAADLVLGVPGLLGWQMLEMGRLMPGFSLGARHRRESVNPGSQDP